MAAAQHILRIPRADEEGSFILVRVSSPTGSAAAGPLSARLVATEGTAPYALSCTSALICSAAQMPPKAPSDCPVPQRNSCVACSRGGANADVASVKHHDIDKLRAKGAQCSQDEWKDILSSLLLGRQPVTNVDAVATVDENLSVTITIRKKIESFSVSVLLLGQIHFSSSLRRLSATAGFFGVEISQARGR